MVPDPGLVPHKTLANIAGRSRFAIKFLKPQMVSQASASSGFHKLGYPDKWMRSLFAFFFMQAPNLPVVFLVCTYALLEPVLQGLGFTAGCTGCS